MTFDRMSSIELLEDEEDALDKSDDTGFGSVSEIYLRHFAEVDVHSV